MAASIELSEGDLGAFLDVHDAIHDERSLVVPPLRLMLKEMLDKRKNPLLQKADLRTFVARRGGRLVGRIACHVHHEANRYLAARDGSFGFFDCIDDEEVARALLGEAETFARAHGCERVRGNLNLTAMQESGVLVDGFEHRPFVGHVYNERWLPRLLAACGYRATHPMTASILEGLQGFDTERWLSPSHKELLASPAYRFRPVDMRRFDEELEGTRELINRAMTGQELFVPLSEAELRFQLKGLEHIVDPRIVWVAEHEGRRVGMVLTLPNLNPLLKRCGGRLSLGVLWRLWRERRRHKEATIVLIAIDPAYQGRGVIGCVLYHMLRALKAAGYERLAGTWISDDNRASIRQTQHLGMVPYHRTAWFVKDLAAGVSLQPE